MDTTSVVIACHGREHLLDEVLAPVLDDPATTEVVLVADRDPRVAARGRALGDGRVRVVEHDAGHEGASRQLGVEAATGTLVVLVDDDVVLAVGAVSGHRARHDRPGRVVVGHMPVQVDSAARTGFPARMYADAYEQTVAGWSADPRRVLTHFWAGNVSLTRDDALTAGLDDRVHRGLYFNDYRLGLRLHDLGLTGVFAPEIGARHLYSRSIRAWRQEARRQGAAHALDGVTPRGGGARPLSRLPLVGVPVLGVAVLAGRLGLHRLEHRAAWTLRGLDMEDGARRIRTGRAERDGLIRPD